LHELVLHYDSEQFGLGHYLPFHPLLEKRTKMKANTETASRSRTRGPRKKKDSKPDRNDQGQVELSLQEYQAIVANAEEVARLGSWKWDLHTRKLIWSDGMFRLFGVDRERFDGEPDGIIANRIHPDDIAAVNEANRKVLEDGVSTPLSYRIVLPDGTEQTVWAQGKLLYDENGRPRSMTGYVQDITERLRAENKILQLQRMYATLSQVNQVIVRVKDRQELFQKICDVAVKYGEISPAWIGLVVEETGEVQPVAANGLDIEQWEHPVMSIRQGPWHNALIAEALHSSQVVTTEDIQADGRTSNLHSQVRDFPFHSLAVIPFHLRGRTIGVLVMVSGQKGLFKDQEEVRLLEEMSLDISFALETMEKEKERQQAEKALLESEVRYRDLVESSNDAIFINRQGKIAFINRRGLEMLGATEYNQIIGRSPNGFFHPDFHALGRERIEQVLVDRVPVPSVEQKIITLDGRTILVEVTTSRVVVNGVPSVQVILRDITERKQAEEKLRQSEEKFRAVFENSPDIIFTVDRDTRIQFINRVPVGVSLEEAVQSSCLDYVQPEHRNLVSEKINLAFRTEESQSFEVLARGNNDSLAWYSTRLTRIKVEDGFDQVLIITTDITERKRAEEALQLANDRFQRMLNSNIIGVVIAHINGDVILANDYYLNLLGVSRQDFLDDKVDWRKYTPPEWLPQDEKAIQQLQERGVCNPYVKEYMRTDGTRVTVLITDAMLDDPEEEQILALILDVTETKQAEEKLRQSEERYRLISENTADVIWVLDPLAGRIKYISPSVEKLSGYTPAEILKLPISKLLTPESMQLVNGLLAEYVPTFTAKQARINSFTREVDHPRKDGSILHTEVTVTFLFNQQGDVEVIGVSRDITERKRTEQTLRENEERLRLSLQAANQGLYDLNVQTGDAVVNREYAEMMGYEYETFIETNARWIERLHPDDQEITAKVYQDYVSGLHPDYRVEFRQKTRDGSWKWILSLGKVIEYDEEGKPLRMLGTHTDITERKQAEEILRESEARFSKIFQTSPMGSLIFRLADGRAVNVNEAALTTMGYSRQEILGHNPQELNIFPEGDYTFNDSIKILSLGESIRNQDTKIRRKSGELRDVLGSLELIELNGEKMVMVITSDITERKRAEEELRASEERYRNLIENMNDIVMEVDANGNYCYLSPNFSHISEYPLEEELGGSALRHIHPDDLPMVLQKLEQSIHMERQSATYRVMRNNGEWRWLETVGTPYRASDGTIHLITVARDITERKQAEDALRRNEHVLRLFVEHSPASIAMFDRDMRYIIASRRYLTDYRLPDQDLTGRSHYEVFPEMPERWKEIHRRCLTGMVEKMEEDPFPREDGTLDWVRWEIRPWYEETGRIGGIILFSEVITERKRAEKAIQDTNEKLAHAQAMAHIGSWEHDLTTDRLYWSDEMYRIMGFPIGKQISFEEMMSVFPLEERAKFRQAINAALYEYSRYSMDYCIVRPDHTRRDIHDEGEVTRDEQGHLIRINGTTQDITDRKRVERDLQTLNVRLEQRVTERTMELSYANRAKDEFLANMSHELRTPLNAILGLSESLLEQRRGPLNERQIQSIDLIASSGKHLLSLINDILEVSKIEAGKLQMHTDTVSVKELCRSSLNFIKELALKKLISVEFTCDESISTLQADPQRVKQVLINLLTNAVKFTPERGRVGLDVSTNAARNRILFSVTDSGIGIAAEDLKKLFTPFTQLDSSLARQYSGTGLGLSLVQKLTEAHGGSVRVESEVGKGSRFTVILPFTPGPDARATDDDSTQLIETDQDSALTAGVVRKNLVVLLAEDNQVNSEMLSTYLQSCGYAVMVAQNGEEVLQRVEETVPDIILMDIQMPKMDGMETTQRLRRDSRFTTTPIIALTALVMHGDRERCLTAGANEYLSKPVSLKTLVSTIEKLTKPKI
jgi:PAS domain S-box-containing protein